MATSMKTEDGFFCRFTLNSEVNLKDALLNMGLGDMFNLATADFTRITSKLSLYKTRASQSLPGGEKTSVH